jgi:hypothetical protein
MCAASQLLLAAVFFLLTRPDFHRTRGPVAALQLQLQG